jgi:hypothetical protein
MFFRALEEHTITIPWVKEDNSKNRAAEKRISNASQKKALLTVTEARSSNPMFINIVIPQKLGLNRTNSKGDQFRYVTYRGGINIESRYKGILPSLSHPSMHSSFVRVAKIMNYSREVNT